MFIPQLVILFTLGGPTFCGTPRFQENQVASYIMIFSRSKHPKKKGFLRILCKYARSQFLRNQKKSARYYNRYRNLTEISQRAKTYDGFLFYWQVSEVWFRKFDKLRETQERLLLAQILCRGK